MSQIDNFDDSHTIQLHGTGTGGTRRTLKTGEIVGGAYRLKSLLGKGGMGYVFCVDHTKLRRQFALKILAPEQISESSRRRFEMEGRAIAKLDHINIVKVYDMSLDADDCPFYVMDLLDGTALSDFILANQNMPLADCLEILGQIASGLGYAHSKGIVHRDVKPSNVILLTDSQERRLVKIVDFGIAKLLPSTDLHQQSQTATGEVFGSPFYMSPEQSMGSAVDHRSDIYSLGCTFYEILCGQPPFRGQNALDTVMMHQRKPVPSILAARPDQNLPDSVDFFLAKMMAKLPGDRYQSMEQLLHDLERIQHGKPLGRAADWPGMARHSPGAQESEVDTAAIKSSLKQLALIVVSLLACGLCIVCLLIGAVQSNKPLLPKAEIIQPFAAIDVANRDEQQQAEAMYNKCPVIKSELVEHDGKMCRKFVFPDWTIGKVCTPGNGVGVEAKGIQYLPAGQDLTLWFGTGDSRQVLFSPEVFSKIGSDEFVCLTIVGKIFRVDGSEKLMEIPQMDGLIAILKTASHWTKLKFVTLSQFRLTEEMLRGLNDLQQLKIFSIQESQCKDSDLAKQSFLMNLSWLLMTECDGVGAICKQLGNSHNIEAVSFSHCQTRPGDILELRRCPNLHVIELDEGNIAPLAAVIPQLQYLREVRLHAKLSPEQIMSITSCKNVYHLWLFSDLYTPTEIAYWKEHDRKVRLDKF